jgi:hypothetical protein
MTRTYQHQPQLMTELGTEQQCDACGAWWPMDPDFFYTSKWGAGYYSTCRACTVQRRRVRMARPQPQQPVPEVFRAVQWGR